MLVGLAHTCGSFVLLYSYWGNFHISVFLETLNLHFMAANAQGINALKVAPCRGDTTEFNCTTACWAVLVQRASAWKALDYVTKDSINYLVLPSLAYPVRAEEDVSEQHDRLVALISLGLFAPCSPATARCDLWIHLDSLWEAFCWLCGLQCL